jgi:Sec-independent protein secretion pathway component TatC
MSDSEIIWKFLEREFPNEHPAIYLYCCGNVKSPFTAIEKLMTISLLIFYPIMAEQYIKTVVKGFLENKKKLYLKGLIKVKPLYEH